MDIGSNDLCDHSVTPAVLSETIFSFAQGLIEGGCKIVILSEILPRQGAAFFNHCAVTTNALLESRCTETHNVKFWRHSRNNFKKRFLSDLIAADCIHVDPDRGMRRYYSSVRGAVLYAEHLLD